MVVFVVDVVLLLLLTTTVMDVSCEGHRSPCRLIACCTSFQLESLQYDTRDIVKGNRNLITKSVSKIKGVGVV